MKRISFFIVASIIILLFFIAGTSCNRVDYSKEITHVDSLKTQLSEYKIQLNSVDSAAIMELKPFINEDIEWIKDSLTKETMNLGTIFLVSVRSGSKLMGSFPSEYSSLKAEIDYSITQLEDLLEDLNKGSIEASNAHKYVNDEVMAYKVIERHINKMLGRLESVKDYSDIRNDFYERIRQQGDLAE